MLDIVVKKVNDGTLNRYEKTILNDSGKAQRISTIRRFLKYLSDIGKDVTLVNHAEVEVFLEKEIKKEGQECTTINNYLSFLKAFFKFLNSQGENLVMDFDKVSIERVKKAVFETFEDNQINEIFTTIRLNKKREAMLRDLIFFEILFYTGCGFKEVTDISIYQFKDELQDGATNYILMDEKILHFSSPAREFVLYDSLINQINEYHAIRLEQSGKKRMRAVEDLFWSKYRGNIGRTPQSTFQSQMADIKKKTSFANTHLSIINIKYTVIKRLLNIYSIDEVSEIVGVDISKVQMFIDTTKHIAKEKKYINTHPFKDILIPPAN